MILSSISRYAFIHHPDTFTLVDQTLLFQVQQALKSGNCVRVSGAKDKMIFRQLFVFLPAGPLFFRRLFLQVVIDPVEVIFLPRNFSIQVGELHISFSAYA